MLGLRICLETRSLIALESFMVYFRDPSIISYSNGSDTIFLYDPRGAEALSFALKEEVAFLWTLIDGERSKAQLLKESLTLSGPEDIMKGLRFLENHDLIRSVPDAQA